MINRRDALKIAAAAIAARATMPLPSDASAAMSIADPAMFVDAVMRDLSDDLYQEIMGYIAPEWYAAYERHKNELRQLLFGPEGVIPYDHPLCRMDEAAHAWAGESWSKGMEGGAAFEQLRLKLIGQTRACPRCDARGLIDQEDRRWLGGPARTCPDCSGAGVVSVTAG